MMIAIEIAAISSLAMIVIGAAIWMRIGQLTEAGLVLHEQLNRAEQQQSRAEQQLHSIAKANVDLMQQLSRLAADVIHRELYSPDNSRHEQAIEAVRAGQPISALIQEHGLSSEEAELIVSLHSNQELPVDNASNHVSGKPDHKMHDRLVRTDDAGSLDERLLSTGDID